MDVLTLLLRLPFLPLQGVIGLARLIEDQAEQQHHDPAAVRRELEAIAASRAAGEISDGQAAAAEQAAVAQLIGPGLPATSGPGERGM